MRRHTCSTCCVYATSQSARARAQIAVCRMSAPNRAVIYADCLRSVMHPTPSSAAYFARSATRYFAHSTTRVIDCICAATSAQMTTVYLQSFDCIFKRRPLLPRACICCHEWIIASKAGWLFASSWMLEERHAPCIHQAYDGAEYTLVDNACNNNVLKRAKHVGLHTRV